MLARLNPGVDPAEIKNLQSHQTSLEEALTETRYRLDSLHLVVVESWGGRLLVLNLLQSTSKVSSVFMFS